jgi:hypothetical protein
MPRLRDSLAAVALAAAGSSAVAAPIVLDTPAKAAAGVLAAHYIGLDNHSTFVQRNLTNLTILTRQIGTFALLRLGATTTPAATLAGPVTVPCPLGGRMTAKMTPTTWLLRIEFVDCKAPDLGIGSGINTYGGIMELDLPAASFTPSTVQLMRAGTATSYMKHLRELTSGAFIKLNRLYSVTLSGNMPVTEGLSGYGVLGSFSYSVNGFSDTLTQVFSDPLLPPVVEARERSIASSLFISGNRVITGGGTVFEDSISLMGGLLTNRRGLGPTTDSTLKPTVLGIQHVSNSTTGVRRSKIDGGLEFTWHPSDGAGCLNGEYRFQNVSEPTTGPATGGAYVSGEMLVNSMSRARYFPAPLPDKMRININTTGVGIFNYLTPFDASSALGPTAGCL